jgi:hypothetical protein
MLLSIISITVFVTVCTKYYYEIIILLINKLPSSQTILNYNGYFVKT